MQLATNKACPSLCQASSGEAIVHDEHPDSAPANNPAQAPLTPLSDEQARVIALCKEGANVFFTGAGGTGKTFLLRHLVESLTRTHGANTVAVVAPTGVAAILCGGQTLHSFAGCDVPTYSTNFAKCWRNKREWCKLRVLIIDEAPPHPFPNESV